MKSIISFVASFSLVYYFLFPQHALAQAYDPSGKLVFERDPALQSQYEADQSEVERLTAEAAQRGQRSWRVITGYSSTSWQTDSTPFVTASGTRVRDGVIASNAFPIGTKVRIPELFGDKVLTIEDRMHERFADRIDVWMPSKWTALKFGKKQAEVEIIEL